MITILVPVFNEEKMIADTIQSIKDIMNQITNEYEIIVINDGSSDNTPSILKSVSGINIINNPYNLGYGASLKRGLKQAQGEWIIITDADGTYPVNDMPLLINESRYYDMVVGSRKLVHSGVPLLRRPAKLFLNKFAGFLTGRKIPDLNSGFRMFKREMAMEFYSLYPSGFSFTSTITVAAMSHDYTVKYVPIEYYKRVGTSTIRPSHFFNFIMLIIRLSTLFNPLKTFLPFAFVLGFGGIFYGAYQFLTTTNIGEVPIMLIIASIQIGFFGILADAFVRERK